MASDRGELSPHVRQRNQLVATQHALFGVPISSGAVASSGCSKTIPPRPKFTGLAEARSAFEHAVVCKGGMHAPCGLAACTAKVAEFKAYILAVRAHTDRCAAANMRQSL